MEFGLCKDCKYGKDIWDETICYCFNEKLNIPNHRLKDMFKVPFDFGCNYFKPKICKESYDYRSPAIGNRMCKLEKRVRDVESSIRALEIPVPNKLDLTDSQCWSCVYINIMRGKCGHPNYTNQWEYPSNLCVQKRGIK